MSREIPSLASPRMAGSCRCWLAASTSSDANGYRTGWLTDTTRPSAKVQSADTTSASPPAVLLAATLFAHEPEAFREHGSAGLYDHGGPLAASMSTISPG